MKALVVLSQSIHDTPFLRSFLEGADMVVAADGGGDAVAILGLEPDVLVGDFDSISKNRLEELKAAGIPIVQYPKEKDETDGELAILYALEKGADSLVVLGAFGGRIDHELANLMLLTRPELEDKEVVVVDGNQAVRILRGGESLAVCGEIGDTLSLIPVGGDARGVTTEGLLYRLQDGELLMGPARGVSNEFVASEATVSLREGMLFVVHVSGRGCV